jgi:hypothetical protein
MTRIRIGNGCGFWGDSPDAPVRLAESGNLDYLTLEYLAELTMSILALLRQRDASAGYATDFIDVLGRLAPQLKKQPGLKIVTNAGGMNPTACAKAAKETLAKAGITDRTVGVVSGDDLIPRLDELIAAGHTLNHLDTGEPLTAVRQRVVSANAYLGSAPIAEALKLGASIVVTGRVADACLTVGPCVHEFGWAADDWHRLSAGTTAGHLIECGAQATGGLWVNADETTGLETVGYPFVDIAADGTFTISKPTGTGGAVNLETVSEQLLYEVADPARYFTPDVVADFTSPTFTQDAPDVVRCVGARGTPASDSYKVSIAYRDGWTAAGTLVIPGPNAVAKARHSGRIMLERLKQAGHTFAHSLVEVLGAGDCVPGVSPTRSASGMSAHSPAERVSDNPEVVLRVAVRDPNKAAVERFTKEFAPLVTSGYAGTTGYTTGRASVREVFAYWPALIAKSAVASKVEVQ